VTNEQSRGVVYGVLAYVLWGAFPLYWPLLDKAGAFEVLGQRIVWSLLFMTALVVAIRHVAQLRALLADGRKVGILTIGAVLVTANWGTYIWAVNRDHVVEAALGYFINPLVTMLLGVVIFRERLRPLQWVALGVAAAAVVVLTIDLGRLPYIALILAFSFGTYGLAKKKADAGAFESLVVETGVVAPFFLVYLVVLAARGDSHFTSEGPGLTALFILSGIVTALPLILFGAAATRVPMVSLGLLQYLAPIFQFALGVFVKHEQMSTGRWIGFAIVWLALAIFTWDALRGRRTQQPLVEAAEDLV